MMVAARPGICPGTVTRLKKRGSVTFFKGCTLLLVPERMPGRTALEGWGERNRNKNNTHVGVGVVGVSVDYQHSYHQSSHRLPKQRHDVVYIRAWVGPCGIVDKLLPLIVQGYCFVIVHLCLVHCFITEAKIGTYHCRVDGLMKFDLQDVEYIRQPVWLLVDHVQQFHVEFREPWVVFGNCQETQVAPKILKLLLQLKYVLSVINMHLSSFVVGGIRVYFYYTINYKLVQYLPCV